MVQGDKFTEGAQGGTNGHAAIRMGRPRTARAVVTPRGAPRQAQGSVRPSGERNLREKFCSLVPNTGRWAMSSCKCGCPGALPTQPAVPLPPGHVQRPPAPRRPVVAPAGTAWAAPLQPSSAKYLLSRHSRYMDLQHPSPGHATGTVPKVQLGTACTESVPRASPKRARPHHSPFLL